MIIPLAGGAQIVVFKGSNKPGLCGKLLATLNDPDETPGDAASIDAEHGKIVVANFQGHNTYGSISVCTLGKGCKVKPNNPNEYYVAGVALAKNGDCWAVSYAPSGGEQLTYYKNCAGDGIAATNFHDPDYVSTMDIDASGNLVILDFGNQTLNVYSGCNPSCTQVAGPLKLIDYNTFQGAAGHLNATATEYAATDPANGTVDVYAYTPTSLTYEYSFSNGLTYGQSGYDGLAFNPRAR